ncbi:unnamed protein product [Protopolystoma xenopodis]|uniref:Uncharacterized protein n=1 Tax=Protopolystoma xenopodis TaxID=117903 RepID=A0A3S5B2I0_9PLAT|nr:unnamed protein product [Protopolystoma xenopodis]
MAFKFIRLSIELGPAALTAVPEKQGLDLVAVGDQSGEGCTLDIQAEVERYSLQVDAVCSQ